MKNRRIPLIRQLIKESIITTQSQLQQKLMEQGVQVTQATLSRDIKMMGIQKRFDEFGEHRYFLSEEPVASSLSSSKLSRLLRDSLVNLQAAQNLVVLKTIPGHAHAVASQFDALEWKDLVGSIAGDDTLLLITKTAEDAMDILGRVESIME
ncbi:MAG: arginine repressor [Symbiobacteriaceae bacterium]|nr:arginine repressor [Symbiobacteriaceae bacterium]